MSFMEDNHIHAVYTYASRVYSKKLFTQEVIVRAVKNLTLEERAAFYAELAELKTSGMHTALFGKKRGIRMLVFGKLVVSFALDTQRNNLIIKSIVPAPQKLRGDVANARNFVMITV